MHEELRERAIAILDKIHDNDQKKQRPIFIEFAGTPKSGKSTCIDTVSHFFRRTGYKVLAPTEGASKRTPYYLKADLISFNVWSASYALTHILEGLYGTDQYHLAILDRGLFDALAWFEFLYSLGDLEETERDTIQQFLLLDKWRDVIDGVFLFRTDPKTSLARENEGKLINEPGRTMNLEILEKLNDAYTVVHKRYADRFVSFHSIDTSSSKESTPQSTAAEVVEKIIGILETEKGS